MGTTKISLKKDNSIVLKGTWHTQGVDNYDPESFERGVGVKLTTKTSVSAVKNAFYSGGRVEFIIDNPASDSGTDIKLPLIEMCSHGCVFELNKFDWINNKNMGVDHYRVVLNNDTDATLYYTHDE